MLRGRHDTSFMVEETGNYLADVPDARVHVLDGGHFVLDTRATEVAVLLREFLEEGE